MPALLTEAGRFPSWLDAEAVLAGTDRAGHYPEAAGHEIVRKAPIPAIRPVVADR